MPVDSQHAPGLRRLSRKVAGFTLHLRGWAPRERNHRTLTARARLALGFLWRISAPMAREPAGRPAQTSHIVAAWPNIHRIIALNRVIWKGFAMGSRRAGGVRAASPPEGCFSGWTIPRRFKIPPLLRSP